MGRALWLQLGQGGESFRIAVTSLSLPGTAFAKGDATRGPEMARGRRGVQLGSQGNAQRTSGLPRDAQVSQERRTALSSIIGTSIGEPRLSKH